jgi:hypothetical protein
MGRGRGPGTGAGSHSVELARHRPAHVGRAGTRLRATFPTGALRSARPRQIRPAGRTLHDGAARPRCAGDRRRSRARQIRLVRAFHGRDGGHVARRQRARAHRPPRPLQHVLPLPRPALLERADRGHSSERRPGGTRRSHHGPVVKRAISRPRSRGRGVAARHAGGHPDGRLHRLLRGDPRHGPSRPPRPHRGSDPDHRRPTRPGDAGRGRGNSSTAGSRARHSRFSTLRIFPMSSSRRALPRRSCASWRRAADGGNARILPFAAGFSRAPPGSDSRRKKAITAASFFTGRICKKFTSEESVIDSASVSTRGSIEHVAHWDHRGHLP